jgi:hypothetical protein
VGEIVIWNTRRFGPVYVEILDQSQDEKTLVRDDDNFTYKWSKTMSVLVDDLSE